MKLVYTVTDSPKNSIYFKTKNTTTAFISVSWSTFRNTLTIQAAQISVDHWLKVK